MTWPGFRDERTKWIINGWLDKFVERCNNVLTRSRKNKRFRKMNAYAEFVRYSINSGNKASYISSINSSKASFDQTKNSIEDVRRCGNVGIVPKKGYKRFRARREAKNKLQQNEENSLNSDFMKKRRRYFKFWQWDRFMAFYLAFLSTNWQSIVISNQ